MLVLLYCISLNVTFLHFHKTSMAFQCLQHYNNTNKFFSTFSYHLSSFLDLFPTEPIINPTKSCIPTTVTVVEPCNAPVPKAVTVTVTEKPSTCICSTKTLTQTVTQTKTITRSPSVTISSTSSYATQSVRATANTDGGNDISNKVEEPTGCKALPPSSLIDAEKGMSLSLLMPLGSLFCANRREYYGIFTVYCHLRFLTLLALCFSGCRKAKLEEFGCFSWSCISCIIHYQCISSCAAM